MNQLHSVCHKHFEPFAFIVDITKDNLTICPEVFPILVTSFSSNSLFISCDIFIDSVADVCSNLGMDTYFAGFTVDSLSVNCSGPDYPH